ncbi:MAG: hypothetical protein PHP28_02190 [Actinomycetota bacterium]|nr:hypothetical protein [Actinomycetota bacterium]MDD5666331.1 hypothetical protein [Actinomycetota bacterium]
MAGTKEKVKKGKTEKVRVRGKEEKHISDQLEEKFVGAKTEVFSRISAKEVEIRTKTSNERIRGDRLIEDAKGQAAAIKRKATLEEIGKDAYAKMIAAAHEEIGEIENATAKEIAEVERVGEKNLDQAVDFIVSAIFTTAQQA